MKRKRINEWMNEKPQKCTCLSNVLAFLSKPERTYWRLTPHLDTVIIEVSSVKALSLRGNPWRLYKAKHLPSQNGTYGDTRFYSGQTSYVKPGRNWGCVRGRLLGGELHTADCMIAQDFKTWQPGNWQLHDCARLSPAWLPHGHIYC